MGAGHISNWLFHETRHTSHTPHERDDDTQPDTQPQERASRRSTGDEGAHQTHQLAHLKRLAQHHACVYATLVEIE